MVTSTAPFFSLWGTRGLVWRWHGPNHSLFSRGANLLQINGGTYIVLNTLLPLLPLPLDLLQSLPLLTICNIQSTIWYIEHMRINTSNVTHCTYCQRCSDHNPPSQEEREGCLGHYQFYLSFLWGWCGWRWFDQFLLFQTNGGFGTMDIITFPFLRMV